MIFIVSVFNFCHNYFLSGVSFLPAIAIAFPFSENYKIINYKYVFYGVLSQAKYGSIEVYYQEELVFSYAGELVGPKASVTLVNKKCLDDFFLKGDLGWAESYIEKNWESSNLSDFYFVRTDAYPTRPARGGRRQAERQIGDGAERAGDDDDRAGVGGRGRRGKPAARGLSASPRRQQRARP